WDMLDYRDVTEGSGFADLVVLAGQAGSQIIQRETLRSPYIEYSTDDDLGSFGPSKQLRRSRRMLDKEGGVQFRRTAPADLASLQRLVLQEDTGWKGAAGTAIAREAEALAFYSGFVAAQSPSFTVVISELVVNDQPIAINLGLEMGSRYFGLKRTYDEAYHKSGPGHLIMQEMLLDLPNRGIFEYDIMGHDEAYKMEWTSLIRQHHHYLVFRPGLKGGLLRRGVDIAIPLVKKLRTRFAQRGLAVGRTGNDTASTDAAKS
ncbi:MAG: GNAT family N-acetyltransferase, partial [Thermomicrobiales bacterium]